MKKRMVSLLLGSLILASGAHVAHAQQNPAAGAATGGQSPAQGDTKNAAAPAEKPKANRAKIRCSTPTCFAHHAGGYYYPEERRKNY